MIAELKALLLQKGRILREAERLHSSEERCGNFGKYHLPQ